MISFSENEHNHFASIKQVAPSFFLEVFLPTLDTYSDLSLIIPWIIASHYNYAGSMAFPLLIHFLAMFVKWYQLETLENKKWSWILLLLQFWPQLQALRVIKMLYKGEKEADKEKKKLEREMGCYEAVLEAIPSIFIMTIIMISANGLGGFLGFRKLHYYNYECDSPNRTADYIYNIWTTYSLRLHVIPLSLHEFRFKYFENTPSDTDRLYSDWHFYGRELKDLENMCAVFGSYQKVPLFFATYGISIISGVLGVTKVLQIGPCPILRTNGPVLGMWSFKFIMCYLTVLFSILGKAFFLVLSVPAVGPDDAKNRIRRLIMLLCLNVLTNLFLAILSLVYAVGCNKKFLRAMFGYPIFMVLPIITPFVMGPKNFIISCSQSKTIQEFNQIGISKKLSILNLLLNVCMYITSMIGLWYDGNLPVWHLFNAYLTILVPILIISVLFSCCTIFNDSCCCPGLIDATHTWKTLKEEAQFLEEDNLKESV